MRKGRVRDSDLQVNCDTLCIPRSFFSFRIFVAFFFSQLIKSKVEAELKRALDAGLDPKHKEVVEARNVLAEIGVHEDERTAALKAVEVALQESGHYPFSTSAGTPGGKLDFVLGKKFLQLADGFNLVRLDLDDRMELFPTDAQLQDLQDRIAGVLILPLISARIVDLTFPLSAVCSACPDALQNGRLVGLVEEYLSTLQETYEDLCVYIAGRAEARAEVDRLLKMVKTLYDAHPLLFKIEELEGNAQTIAWNFCYPVCVYESLFEFNY
jgi:hypothetical protein